MPAAPPVSAVDEAAMAQAQKHAKWAISALNFEDVNTAVMELRRALQSLGVA
jgi:vacuolar protein sorting-associated protein VTA1